MVGDFLQKKHSRLFPGDSIYGGQSSTGIFVQMNVRVIVGYLQLYAHRIAINAKSAENQGDPW